jgi:hypothetical protein
VQNISIDKELRAVATAALERATTVLANVTRLAEERPLQKSELDSQLAEARAMLAPEPLKDVEAVRAELREAENALALALSTPIKTPMETDALKAAIARSVAAGVSEPEVSAASTRLDLAVAAIASLQAAIAAETHASEALIAALEEAKAAHIYGELDGVTKPRDVQRHLHRRLELVARLSKVCEHGLGLFDHSFCYPHLARFLNQLVHSEDVHDA